MAYTPISQVSTPFEDYPNYWLKGYEQGTTTDLSMATDAAAGTLLAKAEISGGGDVPIGFIKTAGDAIFIPYFSKAYDIWLFPTAAEADADDTTNAIQVADNINSNLSTEFATVAAMVAGTSMASGNFIQVENYSATILSGVLFFEVVAAGTGTADGGEYIDLPNTTPALQAKQNFNSQYVTATQYGAPYDGTDALTEITAALATGRVVHCDDNRTFDVSASILIEDFQHLELGGKTTIRGAVSPAIRVKGERGSVKGQDFSSIVRLVDEVASSQGVVKIGHVLIADADNIQYNTVENLRIIGDDPQGTYGTHTGVDTIGLLCLNLGEFNENGATGNGFVFFNQVHNILFEDVKEAYVLTTSVNAQISSKLYFRRIGEFGIHCFAPLISDAAGTQYGQDWTALKASTTTTASVANGSAVQIAVVSTTGMAVGDAFTLVLSDAVVDTGLIVSVDSSLLVTVNTVAAPGANSGAVMTAARLGGAVAENSFSEMFIDGSFQDTTGAFPIMAFIRLEYRTITQQFSAVMCEPGSNTVSTSAEGYHIDSSVQDCRIHGDFNIAPQGTNSSTTTSIWSLSSNSLQQEMRVSSLVTDLHQVQTPGTVTVPHTFQVGSTTTGVYWSAADEMSFTAGGTVRYTLNADLPPLYSQKFYDRVEFDGDIQSKTIGPAADNLYNLGSASVAYKDIYSVNAATTTSDERQKSKIKSLSSAEKNAALEIKGAIGGFEWLTDKETELGGGDKAQVHFGVGAQTVVDILISHGLVPSDYGFVVYSEWEAEEEIKKKPSKDHPGGRVAREKRNSGSRFGIKYNELLAMIIAAL